MTDDYEFQRGLERLIESGDELLARQRELEEENAALIAEALGGQPLPENPVTVTVDERRLVEAIDFDEDAARALPPAQLLGFITAAIGRATARPLVPVSVPYDLRELGEAAAADGGENAARVAALMRADLSAPQVFRDDFGNFSVSALLGSVTAIEAQDRWVTSSPLRMIGEEITRISREAMVATDSLGLHTGGQGR